LSLNLKQTHSLGLYPLTFGRLPFDKLTLGILLEHHEDEVACVPLCRVGTHKATNLGKNVGGFQIRQLTSSVLNIDRRSWRRKIKSKFWRQFFFFLSEIITSWAKYNFNMVILSRLYFTIKVYFKSHINIYFLINKYLIPTFK
jgi:hypothetical protein